MLRWLRSSTLLSLVRFGPVALILRPCLGAASPGLSAPWRFLLSLVSGPLLPLLLLPSVHRCSLLSLSGAGVYLLPVCCSWRRGRILALTPSSDSSRPAVVHFPRVQGRLFILGRAVIFPPGLWPSASSGSYCCLSTLCLSRPGVPRRERFSRSPAPTFQLPAFSGYRIVYFLSLVLSSASPEFNLATR